MGQNPVGPDYGVFNFVDLFQKALNVPNSKLTDLLEGRTDLYVNISGSGATRISFLGYAEGRITVIGRPGKILGRRIDLWSADLIPTMLSPMRQREDVTEMKYMFAHIELKEGLAGIED
jgi:hypothetical protein